MKYLFLTLIFIPLLFSCKKETSRFDSLKNSNWTTYYQYNGFNFYASTNLHLAADFSCSNKGNLDTNNGTWNYQEEKLNVQLDNNTVISAVFVGTDSLAGIIKNGSNSGIWSARKNQ